MTSQTSTITTPVQLDVVAPVAADISQSSIAFAHTLRDHDGDNDRNSPALAQHPGDTSPKAQDDATSDHVTSDPKIQTTAIIIITAAGVNFGSTALSGVLTVAITTIAADVSLSNGLLLWPASIYSLVCGCTLLIGGSLSDAFGPRRTLLVGTLIQALFTMATGLSRNSAEVIVFRGICGLSQSLCLPAATSVITTNIGTGQRRNIAFACMGGGQPLGFATGLTLGGLFADTVGWRWAFHTGAIYLTITCAIAFFGLPPDPQHISGAPHSLKRDIDWIGALIACISLASLSYVLASVTTSRSSFHHPLSISLLVLALLLVPAFIWWMNHQLRQNPPRPALIPNSLWRSRTFTTISLICFILWGAFNGFEQILTLYILKVQNVTPLDTSLRFLSEPVSGVASNILIGTLVHRIRADIITIAGVAVSTIAPVLMAVAPKTWSYWRAEMPSMVLLPIAVDCLFTISNLVITASFSRKDQGLAAAVFQTVSQIGKSVGLALVAVIASSVSNSNTNSSEMDFSLLKGYRASFWFCVAANLACLLLAAVGLRSIGKVGLKKE